MQKSVFQYLLRILRYVGLSEGHFFYRGAIMPPCPTRIGLNEHYFCMHILKELGLSISLSGHTCLYHISFTSY